MKNTIKNPSGNRDRQEEKCKNIATITANQIATLFNKGALRIEIGRDAFRIEKKESEKEIILAMRKHRGIENTEDLDNLKEDNKQFFVTTDAGRVIGICTFMIKEGIRYGHAMYGKHTKEFDQILTALNENNTYAKIENKKIESRKDLLEIIQDH